METKNGRSRVRGLGICVVAPAVLAALSLEAIPANAATLAWDPLQTHGGTSANPIGSGGNGLWQADEGVAKWSNGPGNTSWGSGPQATNTALFGGTAGTVTTGSNLRPGGITFGVSGYTLAPGSSVIQTPFAAGPGTDVAAASTSTMTIDTGTGFTNTISAPINGGGNASFIGGMFTVQGTGTLTLSGSVANGQARAIVANGATLVLGKDSIAMDRYALGAGSGVANQTLVVQSGGTARFSGTGDNQIRDRGGRITIAGTLDMNGHSEATGPGTFNSATLNFTLGSSLGQNDALFLANNTTEITVGSFATTTSGKGAATVTGTNTINIAARSGITSLTDGNYTLIYAASGLGTAAWSLGSNSIVVGGTTYNLSLASSTATAQILTVTAVAVPEPAALGLLGLGALCLRRRPKARLA